MARHEYSKAEINRMDYQTRCRLYKEEETKLISEARNISSADLANQVRELVEKWKV